VLTAADGLEGLHALSKSLPDLIISDLNMPRMSGFEFLAVVRERFPHIATIAVSGEYLTSGNPSGIGADSISRLMSATRALSGAFIMREFYALTCVCQPDTR
jgi:CheY-like chemotaxis protein